MVRSAFSVLTKRILTNVAKTVGYGTYGTCVLYCILEFIGDFVACSGSSMEPTIYTDDILITEHISVMRGTISKGDIVISKSPLDPAQYICKRVVGLPGDKISTSAFGFAEVVPLGHVWIEGDNKNNSSDSRNYGPVPMGLLRGRAICKIWPPSELAALK